MSTNATPEVGGALRAQRHGAGYSQERLARLADCSLSMVRLLESGYVPEHSEVLDRISTVLSQTSEGPAGNGTLAKAEAPANANGT